MNLLHWLRGDSTMPRPTGDELMRRRLRWYSMPRPLYRATHPIEERMGGWHNPQWLDDHDPTTYIEWSLGMTPEERGVIADADKYVAWQEGCFYRLHELPNTLQALMGSVRLLRESRQPKPRYSVSTFGVIMDSGNVMDVNRAVAILNEYGK